MVTCILLSAGLSQRFGSPKAIAKLSEETCIEHILKLLISVQVDETIVVLGAHADLIKPHLLDHKHVKFVYNKDYIFGQTSSFKAGLRAISQNTQGIMLLPVDYPTVNKDTLTLLVQHFNDHHPRILIPTYQDKKGHPPIFSIELKDEFLALNNDTGLNSIAHAHADETAILPVEDEGIIRTFNTQKDFEAMKMSIIRGND